MNLENWQKAKNLIQMIENLDTRKFELNLLLDSVKSNKFRRIYISIDNYPGADQKIPLYNDEKIIEILLNQLEETEKLLDQRKKEFDNL